MMSEAKLPETRQVQVRFLILAGSQADFELIACSLAAVQLNVTATWARSREDFEKSLCETAFNLVLAENELPGWNGMGAFEFLCQQGADVPFILITSPQGEERAVQCMKAGLSDYVWKTRLNELPAAVSRALEEKRNRDDRSKSEALLRESVKRFHLLADSIASAVFIHQGTKCRYANRAAQSLTGYSEEELLALNSWDLVHPDSRASVIQHGFARAGSGDAATRYELKILTKDAQVRWLDVTAGKIEFEGQPAGLTTALDITARKLAEACDQEGSARDPLTGLLNVIQLQGVFRAETKRSERTGRSFSLMLLKLEGLKEINERFGFPAGGRALCKLSFVVGAVCRSGDVPCRYSEDEFIILLPETSAAGVRQLAARIAQRLSDEAADPPFSVSAGRAVYPQEGPTVEHLARAAGRNLLKLKTTGPAKELARTA
jgi:diguanylate cyclase (GGDEF)-like protein/PAS domain S-box-containing protein